LTEECATRERTHRQEKSSKGRSLREKKENAENQGLAVGNTEIVRTKRRAYQRKKGKSGFQ